MPTRNESVCDEDHTSNKIELPNFNNFRRIDIVYSFFVLIMFNRLDTKSYYFIIEKITPSLRGQQATGGHGNLLDP